MKLESLNQKDIRSSNYNYVTKSVNRTHSHNQSFGIGSAGNAVVSLMDMVDRGGLVASFLIQDFFGMNIPRTVTGLYRNKEVTNQYNYQEAAEVAIREFMSGPTMFAVPMIMLWGIKRMFGTANDVPVNILRIMGDNFANLFSQKTAVELADPKLMKQAFYESTFKNILKNTLKSGTSDDVINQEAKRFTDDLLEYEALKAQKKTKSFIDKIKGRKISGSAEDKLADIISRFGEINKANAVNPSANFLEARISFADKSAGKSIDRLVVDMKNFVEDVSKSVSKRVKKNGFNSDDLKQFLQRFTDFRTGSRVLTNLSMIVGTITFCSIIPKLYQLSAQNPGLKGLKAGEAKDEAAAKNSNETSKAKPVAFSGAVQSIGRVASNNNWVSKILKEFEFDGFNISFTGLLTACGLGVLLPRLYHAREENEYKEVLFRDTVTIGTIACAAKILQQVFARLCTKVTGLALAIKPEGENKSLASKVWSYLRPVNGHHVLNSSQLYTKYTGIDKYNGGVVGFAKFLDEQGGNISKAFNSDKNAKLLLQEIYNKSVQSTLVDFAQAKNADIISALEDVVKNKKADDLLNKLYDIFKDEKNTFLKRAKVMNSSFNFAVLFAVVPVLLGFVIPRLNEILTKKRVQKSNQNGNDNIAKTQVNQTEKANKTDSVLNNKANFVKQSNSKAFTQFKEILEH